MYVVYLAGGIASGKSTVARALEARGAVRIDLDALAREVCEPGSPAVAELARAFGDDVVDPCDGTLRRDVLARRAFVSEDATRTLEAITHPAIFAALERRLAQLCAEEARRSARAPVAAAAGTAGDAPCAGTLCVVEVPLLDRALAWEHLADEVVCVVVPTELRRERAIARGMDPDDFDRRDARQPSQEFLVAHAHTTLANDGDADALMARLDAWHRNLGKERPHA